MGKEAVAGKYFINQSFRNTFFPFNLYIHSIKRIIIIIFAVTVIIRKGSYVKSFREIHRVFESVNPCKADVGRYFFLYQNNHW